MLKRRAIAISSTRTLLCSRKNLNRTRSQTRTARDDKVQSVAVAPVPEDGFVAVAPGQNMMLSLNEPMRSTILQAYSVCLYVVISIQTMKLVRHFNCCA